MTALEARKAILADLEAGGYLKETEALTHDVGTCYRCHTVVEPMVSKQWFVKMEPLAKPAIESVREGRDQVRARALRPRTTINWMENIRDWCISRQLWWGHQHPRLVLRRLRRDRGCQRGSVRLPQVRLHPSDPGPRHAGHLVLALPCGRSPPWAGRMRTPRITTTSTPPTRW